MRLRIHTRRRAVTAVLGACLVAVPAGAAGAQTPDPVEVLRVRLAETSARLDQLYADADTAILAYEEQRLLLLEATDAYEEAREKADSAADLHKEARTHSVRYAVSVYQGADLSPVYAWTDGGGPRAAAERDGYLRLLDSRGTDRLNRASAANLVREGLRRRARTAQEARGEAVVAAAEAKDSALEAVEAQEAELKEILARQTELEAALTEQSDTAVLEAEREHALEQARDAADGLDEPSGSVPDPEHTAHPAEPPPTQGASSAPDGPTSPAPRPRSDGPTDPSGDTVCVGGPSDRYSNGQIPVSALCPLPQPGEMLRADAAAAFIELDGAYRDRFGRPMCVTDSYRPFTEQVRLFREKPPGMAARPGSSAHGLGIAVDLCGGVHEHHSPEHTWMLRNAPSYGWVNPAWARDGFEPWHWEYQP